MGRDSGALKGLTRVIKSVVTGQAPVTLEWRIPHIPCSGFRTGGGYLALAPPLPPLRLNRVSLQNFN